MLLLLVWYVCYFKEEVKLKEGDALLLLVAEVTKIPRVENDTLSFLSPHIVYTRLY